VSIFIYALTQRSGKRAIFRDSLKEKNRSYRKSHAEKNISAQQQKKIEDPRFSRENGHQIRKGRYQQEKGKRQEAPFRDHQHEQVRGPGTCPS